MKFFGFLLSAAAWFLAFTKVLLPPNASLTQIGWLFAVVLLSVLSFTVHEAFESKEATS